MAGIDDNRGHAAMAATDDANLTPTQVRVDPSTARLLIDVAIVSSTTPGTIAWKPDDNRFGVSEAVTDDSNENASPLIIDSRNGLLFCDMTT